MEREAANFVGEVPERFVPDMMRGQLAEAEHLDRYWWAAGMAGGRRVLDAGCGMAYGSAMLAGSGAREVVGVDIASSVLDSARPGMPPAVSLRQGDLRRLPFGDDEFDMVVCFEAIEHVEDPLVVLDELARVMTPGALLAVSSPNKGVYVEGNPHHHHEFEPAELRAALEKRFEHVELFRQQAWITSAILDDDTFASGDGAVVADIDVRKVFPAEPGMETYTVALASDAPLPAPRRSAVVTQAAELRRWLQLWAEQDAIIRANIVLIAELEAKAAERAHLRSQLYHSEQAFGVWNSQNDRRIADLESTIDGLRDRAERAEDRVAQLELRAEEIVDEFRSSSSWRLTGPLRQATSAVKRVLRG